MARVLVVDDAPDIRMLVKAVLGREGFDVTEAGSGPAALDALRSGSAPDLVLLDVQMPEMDGWQTLDAIKAQPEDTRRAWELGCDGYLVKPFAITALVQEVATVAARSPLERRTLREIQIETRTATTPHQTDNGATAR
jgi:CheY-like chemotaxis protein